MINRVNFDSKKLNRDFYLRPTLEVACDLIGKYLIYNNSNNIISARIVEVEAYIGEDDPACHAAVGKTDRNEIMYGIGGFSYIYFIYGMYYCLNIVTEREGYPAAILIRGAEPIEGLEIMRQNYPGAKNNRYTDGPGKLCKAFGLTREKNGLDLIKGNLYLENREYDKDTKNRIREIKKAKRIGIKKGINRKWRFYESDSEWVSVKEK
ncbi:MAG: DNA-3-methyladenine glycosylase [candidate division Zixibacteria bacterium]|nr:DNA-3-methyladenine glycosylase [candidate division Zixibacteria bacterium]